MKKILLEDALILSVVRFARFLVHVLPLRASLASGRFIGRLAYFASKRRKIAYRNLRAAFAGEKSRAEMRRIARRSMENLGLAAIELLRFPDLTTRYVEQHIEFQGLEKFQPYSKEGKGIIFLTAHFGCWELLNATGGIIGYPMLVLARVQKHPRSDEFLNNLRASKGSQVIRKGMPVREILKALKKGEIVGMLSDQDGGKNGSFVRFFNRWSSSPKGVATFAVRTGAPIFPVFIFRKDHFNHRIEVEGPLVPPGASASDEETERVILQQFADTLESKIRKAPDQWLWAHRRWKSTPDRSVLVLSDGKTGHLNQSLAVLEAIKEERASQGALPEQFHSKIVEIRFRSKFRENFLKGVCLVFQGRVPFKAWFLRRVLDKKCLGEILAAYADVVVSCGSSILGVNLLAKNENEAKSVVVMKPSFSARCFDAVIAPRHDKMKPARNVFVTDRAPSLITGEFLAAEAEKLSKELDLARSSRKIGFLVGGDTDKLKFSRDAFEGVLRGLERFSAETRSVFLATSSRRTPSWADELLKKTFEKNRQCPLLVIANESNREGAVAGILGLSDVLVVSGESISMVSEAVSSGKPVVVFKPWANGAAKPKYHEFLNQMLKEELIISADSKNIYDVLKQSIASATAVPNPALLKDREVLRQAIKKVI